MKTRTCKLSIGTRILLENVMPRQGNFEDNIVANDLKGKIKITQEDLDTIEFKSVQSKDGNHTTHWNEKKDPNIEVKFTGREVELISKLIDNLSKENKLPSEVYFMDFCKVIKGVK